MSIGTNPNNLIPITVGLNHVLVYSAMYSIISVNGILKTREYRKTFLTISLFFSDRYKEGKPRNKTIESNEFAFKTNDIKEAKIGQINKTILSLF